MSRRHRRRGVPLPSPPASLLQTKTLALGRRIAEARRRHRRPRLPALSNLMWCREKRRSVMVQYLLPGAGVRYRPRLAIANHQSQGPNERVSRNQPRTFVSKVVR